MRSVPGSSLLRCVLVSRSCSANLDHLLLHQGRDKVGLQVHTNMLVMDAPSCEMLPHKDNVFLSDIRPEDLVTEISRALHCKYLSPSSATRLQEAQGRLYGPKSRSLFTLPVTCKGMSYKIHFVFVTGSPATCLAPSALAAWNIASSNMANSAFQINGCHIPLSCSDDPVWNK